MFASASLTVPCPFAVVVRNGTAAGTVLWTSPCGAAVVASAGQVASPAFAVGALVVVAPTGALGFSLEGEVRAVAPGFNADRAQEAGIAACGEGGPPTSSAAEALFDSQAHSVALPPGFDSGYIASVSSGDVDGDGDEVRVRETCQ